MRRLLLVLLFGTLTISAHCFAAVTEVEVLSTDDWQSTGVSVKKGTSYGVWQTGGTWTVDHRNFEFVDGAGYSPITDPEIFQGCKYNESWPYGLLLGRIGNDVFPIGRGGNFEATQDGILELSIHDNVNCLADNEGILSVKVEDKLKVQGLLNRVADEVVNSLTDAERERLLLLTKNIAACGSLKGNVQTTECANLIVGLLSFVVSPEPVE